MKDTKEKMMETIDKIVEATQGVTPTEYDCQSYGKHYTEKVGTYSNRMTNAMVSDMRTLGLLISRKDVETAKKLFSICKTVEEKDIAVRRMFDDLNDGRPVQEYNYEKTEPIIDLFLEIKKAEVLSDDQYKDYVKCMRSWIEKITKMDIWAYYLTSASFVDEVEIDIEVGMFSEENITLVKTLITFEKLLLSAIKKLPMSDKLSTECMDKIELINGIVKAIQEDNKDVLDRLYKYASAVADFSE